MYIDFHTHLDQYQNRSKLLQDLAKEDIFCVAAATGIKSYYATKEIARKSGKVLATFGIHPDYVEAEEPFSADFEGLMAESSVIGEIGMDFFWSKTDRKVQEKIFRQFLYHCNKNHKYCVIHTKGAEKEILDILQEYPECKPVIHWYDGPEQIYREYMHRGYMATFGCETCRSEYIQKLLRLTPLEQLLCETDNPTGEPWLGGTDNSIRLIKRVYRDVAAVLGISEQELCQVVEGNSRRILKEI